MSAIGLGTYAASEAKYGAGEDTSDKYLGRLIRAIPGDIVAGYVAVSAVIPSGQPSAGLITALCFLVLTPIVVGVAATRSAGRTTLPIKAMGVASAAFVVWVISLPGSPLQEIFEYPDWVRALILIVATILLGLVRTEAEVPDTAARRRRSGH